MQPIGNIAVPEKKGKSAKTSLMSKQFKNLVSASGECHQSNAMTGFASNLSGSVNKMKLMGSLSDSQASSEVKASFSTPVMPQQTEGAEFYRLDPVPNVAPVFPMSEGWVDEFAAAAHPSFTPPLVLNQARRPPGVMFHPSQYMGSVYTPESQQVSAPVVAENDDLAAAKRMVEVLRGSGNPKFANSTFVDFIDQVANGDLKLKDGSVVDREGKQVDWDDVYQTEESELLTAGDDADNFPDQMDRIWNELRRDNEFLKGVGSSGLRDPPQYDFHHKSNAYIDSENILEMALRLLREGKDSEALMALEAEVRVNPNSSEGWRLLGQLHAQFDRDSDAIKCLEKGHFCDPFNLESILALGVSLTNELDSVRAMEVLKKWIESNDQYHFLLISGDSDSASKDLFPDYDFTRLKNEVMTLFNRAAQINSSDPDVQVALGVLHNINRDYSYAVMAFLKAVELRPLDFAAWNKLGATLANAGLSREALDCYHQALRLKPIYARAWGNLAIAHSNLEEYENASKFFLTALQISPDCSHLWASLVIALSHWQPENLHFHSLIENKDIPGLLNAISGSLRIENLPARRDIDPLLLNALKSKLDLQILPQDCSNVNDV